VVQAPTCQTGNLQCSLSARDEVNNQIRQSNITSLRLDANGGKLKAIFSYQAANRQGVDVRPISAQGEVHFAAVAEWVDANSDGKPQANELSNTETVAVPGSVDFRTASILSGPNSNYIPFALTLTINYNLTAQCYIVNNDSFYVPMDNFKLSGYGVGCHITVSKSHSIAPTSNIVLILNVDTSLPGGVVSPGTLETFTWGPLSGYQARRVQAGGSYIIFGSKANTNGNTAPSNVNVALGDFTATTGTEYSVPVGLATAGVNSFEFDVAFEPQQIFYESGAASVAASIVGMVALICAIFAL